MESQLIPLTVEPRITLLPPPEEIGELGAELTEVRVTMTRCGYRDDPCLMCSAAHPPTAEEVTVFPGTSAWRRSDSHVARDLTSGQLGVGLLLHRSGHSKGGEWLWQQRSKVVAVLPGVWDAAASGGVAEHPNWRSAVLAEAAEELGM